MHSGAACPRVLSSADIPARFAELVEAMGDEERARVAVEQNPNTLRFANIKIMFAGSAPQHEASHDREVFLEL